MFWNTLLKFQKNLRWVAFGFVELAWNDPLVRHAIIQVNFQSSKKGE